MFAKYKFIERKSRFLLPPIYTCYKHNEETAMLRRACNTGYLSVCCLVSIGQPIPKVPLQVFVYLSYIIYFLMLFLFLSQITQYLTIITEIFRTLVCSRCVLLFFWQKISCKCRETIQTTIILNLIITGYSDRNLKCIKNDCISHIQAYHMKLKRRLLSFSVW